MNKIIEKELMSGSLLLISEPHLIKRYNKALKAIADVDTKLDKFYIDISGFSQEIAEELNNSHYLNMGGVNQNIIILTPEQKNLPMIHSYFTSTRYFIESFIENNYQDVLNITSKDVIYGEIEDNIVKINTIEDIANIKKVWFEIETGDNVLQKIAEFEKLEAEIMDTEEAWYDDDIINKMIELAHITGNIKKRKVSFDNLNFESINFYTNHLDGVYKFQIKETTYFIPKNGRLMEHDSKFSFVKFNEDEILTFLDRNFKIKYTENTKIIKAKIDHLVIIEMIENGDTNFSKANIKKFIFDNYEKMPSLYLSLEKIYKDLENGEKINMDDYDTNTKLALIRLKNPKSEINFRLVSHLLSNFNKYDFTYLYAFNKSLFYDTYEKINSEVLKDYISDYLVEHYVPFRKEIKKSL